MKVRAARAKIVNGKVVTKAKYPEGTKLLLVPEEPQPAIALDEEDREALDEAIAATKSGKLIPLQTVRALLRTL